MRPSVVQLAQTLSLQYSQLVGDTSVSDTQSPLHYTEE